MLFIRYQNVGPFHQKKPVHSHSIISLICNLRIMKEKHNFFSLLFSAENSRPAKADFVLRGASHFYNLSLKRISPWMEIPPHFFNPIIFSLAKREMFW